VSHCPQRIDIPKEMRRIDTMVENLKRDGKVKELEL
jgi:predicted aldo/keto reductase-like oxidoreductase